MVAASLVSVAFLLAEQGPTANGNDAFVNAVSHAGDTRRQGGDDESLFLCCAEEPACAQGCEETLRVLGGNHLKASSDASRCTWLRQIEGFADQEDKAKALPIVRERVRVLSEKIRPQLNQHMRDRLDCGLSRIRLAKSNAAACARNDAYGFLKVVEYFGDEPEEERSRWPLAHACQPLETCAADCWDELSIVWSIDWSRFDGFDPKRVAEVKHCPEFGQLLLAGPVNETEARARVWADKRAKDFAARACKLLDESERAKLACEFSRLKAPLEASACGPTPTGCEPLPPSQPPPPSRPPPHHRRK